MRRRCWQSIAMFFLLLSTCMASAQSVVLIEIHDAITPASSSYFLRGLHHAEQSGAELMIVRLNTPGGLDTSMREMIQAMLVSNVPVAIYVAPSGSRAASAGTYMLYASHVAAMAPGTNLGAATPVQIAAAGGEDDKEKAKPDPKTTKAVQDAAAYIRSLAQLRNRNVEWAEQAVFEAKSLSANEALELNVIDLIAKDIDDLLQQVDGRQVSVADVNVTLNTKGAAITTLQPNWQEQALAMMANPNIALLLMMIGVYGLLFEFYTPGSIGPGVIGAICLLLGAYGLAMLPLNIVGIALIVLGLGLMVAEAMAPSFGVLGVGGIVAFIIGALMLIDADIPGIGISWQMVVPLALTSAVAIAMIGMLAMKVRKRKPVFGGEAMIGERVLALESFDVEGRVQGFGEVWQARSGKPLQQGQAARVIAREGLTLIIEPEGEN